MSVASWVKRQIRGELRPDAVKREVLCAQLALFRQARLEGVGVLVTHADPIRSPILRRYKHLRTAPSVLGLLGETMTLLGSQRSTAELEVLIDAWIEIETARHRVRATERDVLRCIRDATLTFHRGARPEQAMRAGRQCLPPADHVSTIDLTTLARQLTTP